MNNSYTKKAPIFMFFGAFLIVFFVVQTIYLSFSKCLDTKMKIKKLEFVNICKLPDLAISTEATYIRHRSMSDIFSIYKDDPSLREYFPSTYVYSHSHIINGVLSEK